MATEQDLNKMMTAESKASIAAGAVLNNDVDARRLEDMGYEQAMERKFSNTNWGFSCLDTAVHMAEEVPQPERNIPIAIMGTIFIGFVTSFFFIISMMYSLLDFDSISTSLAPILQLFYNALQNKAGAIFLESLVIATGIGCQIACQTWQSRLRE
ncbi:choline transporter [Kalmusia sp. IMI 367209]|nr:choline transporter [Kalmusia sp. IMI 367209]